MPQQEPVFIGMIATRYQPKHRKVLESNCFPNKHTYNLNREDISWFKRQVAGLLRRRDKHG